MFSQKTHTHSDQPWYSFADVSGPTVIIICFLLIIIAAILVMFAA